jgi:hypothetical protein
MNRKESNSDGGAGNCWEQLCLEEIEVGSNNYRVLIAALKIGRMYYYDVLTIPASEQQSGLNSLLSKLHREKIEKCMEEIKKDNENNPGFIDKFNEVCGLLMTDLGTIPSIKIAWRLGILENKIKEADSRADLV